MLWAEDPVVFSTKRVRQTSQRDDYLQGTWREVSITLEMAEKQTSRLPAPLD